MILRTERLFYTGSLSRFELRPRHHAPVRWPWALCCVAALIALVQWLPVARQVMQ